MKIGSIQSLACVGLGTCSASSPPQGTSAPSSRAGEATTAHGSPRRGRGSPTRASTKPSCCSEGVGKEPAAGAGRRVAATTTDQGRAGRGREEAEHRLHHGRRHRHLEHRRLPPRHDGRADAEPRQARQGGHAVHRLLRRGELHGGPRGVHHRRVADPHRHDDGRPGRGQDRAARRGLHDRHGAQGPGLRHGAVRQEPPRRPQRVPAHRPRVRRVLRLPVPPGRDGRPRAPRLPAGAAGPGRPAEHGPLVGQRTRTTRP